MYFLEKPKSGWRPFRSERIWTFFRRIRENRGGTDMKTVARYQCEKCRKIYDIPGEAIACEAGHYGLSVDEYNKWLALKKLAENAGKMVSIAKNEKTDREFDVAVQKLVDFEKEHNLEEK